MDLFVLKYQPTDLAGRVFANGPRDQASIPSCHTKAQKNNT